MFVKLNVPAGVRASVSTEQGTITLPETRDSRRCSGSTKRNRFSCPRPPCSAINQQETLDETFLVVVLLFAAVTSLDRRNLHLQPTARRTEPSPATPARRSAGATRSKTKARRTGWSPPDLAPGSFQFGTPDVIFDFPIVAPASTVTSPFNAAASTGLMALTWDASAPLGAVEFGSFLLDAEWWNGDPLSGGPFASSASPLSQPYNATVAPVPEPGTGALMILPLLVAGVSVVRRRWRQSTSTLN